MDESTAISSAVGQVVATDVDSGEAGLSIHSQCRKQKKKKKLSKQQNQNQQKY